MGDKVGENPAALRKKPQGGCSNTPQLTAVGEGEGREAGGSCQEETVHARSGGTEVWL